ncbi:15491_t:CDS:2 [Cetraspora pellucida]|uniref:15491_t:CDS:1 n=1 Tax=Cetraspora pellucida TaxID=1433469 RepID=A0A9N9HWH3_9GLOM|nr:15491_t:CDS:2 [Cetraspora pellucida]
MLFFLIFTVSLFVSVVISKPEGRYAAASALVDYRLYFIGGQFQDGTISSELFYLDLSTSFNANDVTSPRWSNLSSTPVASAWATATVGGGSNSILFLIGGIMVPSNHTMVYSFNTNIENWSNITTSDVLNQRRKGSSLSYDPDSGKIYIFGGQSISNLSEWFNEMIIFDSIHFSWSNVTLDSAPSKRSGHTATLLKTGIIVFIGGWELNDASSTPTLANMSQNAKFINTTIDSRVYHSAVLASDGKIIIYGGSNGTDNRKVLPDLAVLNVSSTQFQWSTPSTTALSSTPRSLVAHTAVMVDDYMILLFDAANDQTHLSLSILIGIIVGDVALAFIIGYSAVWCYRKHRIKHTSLITTREVLHYSDNDSPPKLEGHHHDYFGNVPSQNFLETPVTAFHYYQPLVFQLQQNNYIMLADGASYNQYPRNEGNVPVINYVQHHIQPQYVEYGMTHNSYLNPNPT